MPGPDFLGIGAQKAATTWLFKRLCMHPEIYFPRGKEVHFWDRRDRGKGEIANYSSMFEGALIDHIGGLTGDITPAYLLLSEERIREIAELSPDLKLLVMLRNPVDRAISAAAQVLRSERGETLRGNPLFGRYTTEGGLYGKHLTRWLSVFPRARLLVLTQDEVRETPREVLRRVSEHLGIDPTVYDRIDLSLLAAATSPTPNRLEITPRQRARLREIYRDDVAALESLLDRRFGWLD